MQHTSGVSTPSQIIHLHVTVCLVAEIPSEANVADFVTELNYWFEPGSPAKIIETEMVSYEIMEN